MWERLFTTFGDNDSPSSTSLLTMFVSKVDKFEVMDENIQIHINKWIYFTKI